MPISISSLSETHRLVLLTPGVFSTVMAVPSYHVARAYPADRFVKGVKPVQMHRRECNELFCELQICMVLMMWHQCHATSAVVDDLLIRQWRD